MDTPARNSKPGINSIRTTAQMFEANSLSRSIAYRCFISSIDLPTSGPGLLKTHAQTEQAQPQNRSCSTHTISRCWAKGHLRQERIAEGDMMVLDGRRVKPARQRPI